MTKPDFPQYYGKIRPRDFHLEYGIDFCHYGISVTKINENSHKYSHILLLWYLRQIPRVLEKSKVRNPLWKLNTTQEHIETALEAEKASGVKFCKGEKRDGQQTKRNR